MRIAGQSVADNPSGRDRDHHAGRTDGKQGPEAEGGAASEIAKGPNNPAIVDEKENTIVEGTNVVDRCGRAPHTLPHTNPLHFHPPPGRAPSGALASPRSREEVFVFPVPVCRLTTCQAADKLCR